MRILKKAKGVHAYCVCNEEYLMYSFIANLVM